MRITDYTNGRTMNVPDTYQPSLLITKNQNSSGFNRLNEEEAVEALISTSSDFQTVSTTRNNFVNGTIESENVGYPMRARAKSASRNAGRAVQTEKVYGQPRSGSVVMSPKGEGASKVKLNSLMMRAKQNQNQVQTNEVKPYRGGPMTIDQVSPELAAQIIKQFVIPMFDTDISKGLRRKHERLGKSKQNNKDLQSIAGE